MPIAGFLGFPVLALPPGTLSSYTLTLEDVAPRAAQALRSGGYDVFELAGATPGEVEARTGLGRARSQDSSFTLKVDLLGGVD